MPIQWNATLDSLILHGVFEECNISFSKALCEKISERVKAAGEPTCTAKAIENRLYSWKKKNVSAAVATSSVPSTPKKNAAKKDPAMSKTPRAKKSSAKKKVVAEDDDEVNEDQLKSPSADRKRAHQSEEAVVSKKVKLESLDVGDSDAIVGDGEVEEEI